MVVEQSCERPVLGINHPDPDVHVVLRETGNVAGVLGHGADALVDGDQDGITHTSCS